MQITVKSEREEVGAWSFDLVIEPAGGSISKLALRLSWGDYDHWCRGASPPASVARAVMAFLLERQSIEEISSRIDASTVRRRFPEIDRELRAHIDD